MMVKAYNQCECGDTKCTEGKMHKNKKKPSDVPDIPEGFQRPRKPVPQTSVLGDFIRLQPTKTRNKFRDLLVEDLCDAQVDDEAMDTSEMDTIEMGEKY